MFFSDPEPGLALILNPYSDPGNFVLICPRRNTLLPKKTSFLFLSLDLPLGKCLDRIVVFVGTGNCLQICCQYVGGQKNISCK
jgi:hypothetical protein